jgi:hypothetical protein
MQNLNIDAQSKKFINPTSIRCKDRLLIRKTYAKKSSTIVPRNLYTKAFVGRCATLWTPAQYVSNVSAFS